MKTKREAAIGRMRLWMERWEQGDEPTSDEERAFRKAMEEENGRINRGY